MTIIGIVSCSKAKLPIPAPAFYLYSASPRFSQAFLTAKTECNQVFIISAKYGLIDPMSIIKPYDTFLDDLDDTQRERLRESILDALPNTDQPINLYISNGYARLFSDYKNVTRPYPSGLFAQAKAMGEKGRKSLREPHSWPSPWILERVYAEEYATFNDIVKWCAEKGYTHANQMSQANRAMRCPLFLNFGKAVRILYK